MKIARDSKFYQLIADRLIHATSISGLSGIIRDGSIKVNLGGLKKTYEYEYLCAHAGGISLLDLKHPKLPFRNSNRRGTHWMKVFSYHQPVTIILFLRRKQLAVSLRQCVDIEDKRHFMQYIPEVEVCHIGDIAVEHIDSIYAVSAYNNDDFIQLEPNFSGWEMLKDLTLNIGDEKLAELTGAFPQDKCSIKKIQEAIHYASFGNPFNSP